MKAIKINAPVNLNSGLQIPPGSVVVISEGLAQLFKTQGGLIPAQIATDVYTSVANYESGKAPVDRSSVADFNPVNYGVQLPVAAYETQTAQDLLLTAVYIGLDQVYPGQCEIIDVANPADITPVSPETQPLGGDGVTQQMMAMAAPTTTTQSEEPTQELSAWSRFLNLFS